MQINAVSHHHSLQLLDIFEELEHYYFKDQAASREDITAYLQQQVFSAHSGVRLIAAFSGTSVVGFASYSVLYPAPKLAGQMFMKDLFVSAQARGQGVGKKLMQHLACLAVELGCKRLDWTAESTNPKAGLFYHGIGAALLAEKEYYRFEGEALSRFASQATG
ncbi:GNAT family N-acetyltransferase [Gallaecimonas mangrovi]|uniref:GNAT family N-acetyltransferase n=1 Tax=Gallaecimonas mangrovi TaxID=2291597 RepID=UPI000E209599|nr:GNAT family N-acetyltransferase [Gallaecimonas mangrovi]